MIIWVFLNLKNKKKLDHNLPYINEIKQLQILLQKILIVMKTNKKMKIQKNKKKHLLDQNHKK